MGGLLTDTEETFDLLQFLVGFEDRFLSYMIEKKLDLAWFWFERGLHLFVAPDLEQSADYEQLRQLWVGFCDESVVRLREVKAGARRGRGERPSGRWTSVEDPYDIEDSLSISKFTLQQDTSMGDGINSAIHVCLKKSADQKQVLSFDFSKNGRSKQKKNGASAVFQIFSCGPRASKVSDTDLCDLLAIPKLKERYWLLDKRETRSHSIVFEEEATLDEIGSSSNSDAPLHENEDSVERTKCPLLRNAPEGARTLVVLAASRRREAQIQIPLPSKVADDEDDLICFGLENGLAKLQSRWVRMNSDRTVFVQENSVPASVIPLDPIGTLYSCCANTLELRGGALRAEYLTLLPPGGLFLLLSFLAFGLSPDGLCSVPDSEEEYEPFIAECLAWLKNRDPPDQLDKHHAVAIDRESRIRMSLDFNKSCGDLGERLICFPDKVKGLCEIFDQIDGYSTGVWKDLPRNPFIPRPENEQKFIASLLSEMRHPGSFYDDYESAKGSGCLFDIGAQEATRRNSERVLGLFEPMVVVQDNVYGSTTDGPETAIVQVPLDTALEDSLQEEKKSRDNDNILRGSEVLEYSDDLLAKSRSMFAPRLPAGEEGSMAGMPTTNLLSICAQQVFAGLLYEAHINPDPARRELLLEVAEKGKLGLTKYHWAVHRFQDQAGKDWYRAQFLEASLPMKNRSMKGMPKWVRHLRPYTVKHGMDCIPPHFRNDLNVMEAIVGENNGDLKRRAILFDDVETALRMESAFFLERSFFSNKKHWYEQSFQDIMQHLIERRIPTNTRILQSFQPFIDEDQ